MAVVALWVDSAQLEASKANTAEKYIEKFEHRLHGTWVKIEEDFEELFGYFKKNESLTRDDYDTAALHKVGLPVEDHEKVIKNFEWGKPLTPDDYDEAILHKLGLTVDKDGVVSRKEPEDPKQKTLRRSVDKIARHFRKVVRCVDNGRCSEQSVEDFYEDDMCGFRHYFYGYIAVLSGVDRRWRLHGDLKARKWRRGYGDFFEYSRDLCERSWGRTILSWFAGVANV